MIYNQYLHALYEAYTSHLVNPTPRKGIDVDHKGDDNGGRDEGTTVGKSGEKGGEDKQGTDLCTESGMLTVLAVSFHEATNLVEHLTTAVHTISSEIESFH